MAYISLKELMNEQKEIDAIYMKAAAGFFSKIAPKETVCKNCDGEGFVMEYNCPDDGGVAYPCDHCQEIGGYVRG